MTLTLTLDRVMQYIVVHHSSTSMYTPNFIKIKETFCGRTDVLTDGHLKCTLLSRLRRVDLKIKFKRKTKLPNVYNANNWTTKEVRKEVTSSNDWSMWSRWYNGRKRTDSARRSQSTERNSSSCSLGNLTSSSNDRNWYCVFTLPKYAYSQLVQMSYGISFSSQKAWKGRLLFVI